MTDIAEIESELEKGQAARSRGNEGMARVCARRAAGMAAQILLQQHGISANGKSAYDHLRAVSAITDMPNTAREAVLNLLTPVDTNFQLPPGVDLLKDARTLISLLDNAGIS